MIDRLREQIQQRLDQVISEVERLRNALAALDPRSSSAPTRRTSAGSRTRTATVAPQARATKPSPARPTSPASRSARRTAPGATKAAVLAALDGANGLTAGQVAEKTGLGRATVSTTLSKLAKSGEVQKAQRGYRLPPAGA